MGLFDFFRGGGGEERAIKKHAARVANKRSQNPERWESIKALSAMPRPEAVEALLTRFSFRIDPSISDQEEKEAVLEGIVKIGEPAIEPVTRYLKTSESIAWPIRILSRLLDEPKVTAELLALLEEMDTEYARDPEKKRELLAELASRKDPAIAAAVKRFTEDVNESCRFHAFDALFAQDEVPDAEFLSESLRGEESMRVRARILDGMAANDIALVGAVPEGSLPVGYFFFKDGKVSKPKL